MSSYKDKVFIASIMPTVEEIQQKLSNETMMRVFGDNDVKNTIVNETVDNYI